MGAVNDFTICLLTSQGQPASADPTVDSEDVPLLLISLDTTSTDFLQLHIIEDYMTLHRIICKCYDNASTLSCMCSAICYMATCAGSIIGGIFGVIFSSRRMIRTNMSLLFINHMHIFSSNR